MPWQEMQLNKFKWNLKSDKYKRFWKLCDQNWLKNLAIMLVYRSSTGNIDLFCEKIDKLLKESVSIHDIDFPGTKFWFKFDLT